MGNPRCRPLVMGDQTKTGGNTVGPLDGIRILDFTQETMSGPFCTMLLSDLGAEVIKMESPVGDPSRYIGPMAGEHTAEYTCVNRGKKSVLMDLEDEAQREIFYKMVKDADVIVDNFTPGTMEKYGCGFEILKTMNPHIIWASVTPFGQTGPWAQRPADDLTVQALSGIMSVIGEPGHKPVKAGIPVAEELGGMNCAIAIVTALYAVMQDGKARRVDVSMMDSVISGMEQPFAKYALTKVVPKPFGNKHASSVPVGDFTAKDGKSILINIAKDENFADFCKALEAPDLVKDPRFAMTYVRVENREIVEGKLNELFKNFDSATLCDRFTEVNVPHSLVLNIADLCACDHVASHQMIANVVYSDGTIVKCLNTNMRMSGMDIKTEYAASALGEDTISVVSRYMSEDEAHKLYDAALENAQKELAARIRA